VIELKDNKKIVIIGAGRSGTTYLVQLLTRMGFDTGFIPYEEPYREHLRAGCETTASIDINLLAKSDNKIIMDASTAPTVMKAPLLSFVIKDLVQSGQLPVAYALIPIRDMHDATISRIDSKTSWAPDMSWDYESVKKMNMQALGAAIEACVICGIPYQTLHYPLFTQEEEYSRGILIQMASQLGIYPADSTAINNFKKIHKKAFNSLLRKL